jgi:hypothetical protein
MPARHCSCGCNRIVFDAFVRSGQAKLIDAEGESIALWSLRCAGTLAVQRPELHAAMQAFLGGRTTGYGCGPRRAALTKAGATLLPLRRPAKKKAQ